MPNSRPKRHKVRREDFSATIDYVIFIIRGFPLYTYSMRMAQMEKIPLQGLKSENTKKIRIAFQMLLLVDIHCNLFPLTYSKICVFKKSVIRKKLRFFSLYFNTFTINHPNNS